MNKTFLARLALDCVAAGLLLIGLAHHRIAGDRGCHRDPWRAQFI